MRHSRLSLLIGALLLSTDALGRVCYEAVDDASAGILQVIHHIREERLPQMLHYRPFFAGQSFLEHDLEKVTNLTVALATKNVGASVFHCRLDYMHFLPCIGELMNLLTTGAFTGSSSLQQEGVPQGAPAWDGCTSRIPVSGFLLHHFDAWVNPHLLRDMDRRLIWLNENGIWGLTDFCGQGAELEKDTKWHWGYTAKREGIVSVQEAMNHGLLKKWPPGRMCRGHADIYYVPTRFMPTFASVAPYFYNSFHEAGIPTLLHISMAEADLDENGKGFSPLRCAGSCCTQIEEDLEHYTCGHQMNLSRAVFRYKMAVILAADTAIDFPWRGRIQASLL